jgi:hypothetical protein
VDLVAGADRGAPVEEIKGAAGSAGIRARRRTEGVVDPRRSQQLGARREVVQNADPASARGEDVLKCMESQACQGQGGRES